MIHLVLSLDYEIFGNGSGDVRRDMIEPTRRLLALCDAHGAKLSIFLEVGEYWAMKRAEQAGTLRLGYSPSQEIEEQLREAIRRGHDVQLHLHPWWIGASFEENRWRLCPQYLRITDLPHGLGSQNDPLSVVGVLNAGKSTLEALLQPVSQEYKCLVYRAAMFWGQPSGELIAGMKEVGLVADSSVVNGLHETAPAATDYRHAPSAMGCWWTSADDIGRAGPAGEHIVEFPVCSEMRPYLYNFKWNKLRTSLQRRRIEKDNLHGHGMMEARKSRDSLGTLLRKLGTRQPLKYDFCKLSAQDMIRRLQQIVRADQREGAGDRAVVLLGHSKDFWNDRHLDAFLRFVKERCSDTVCFRTLGDLARTVCAGCCHSASLANDSRSAGLDEQKRIA
ncbi:MAG: hypothetical protein GXY19_16405 [Phycisphaerae bacterium]|nr:hypothetical protein [Phycisphaerae bacterium]